jgi:hypothetical protein
MCKWVYVYICQCLHLHSCASAHMCVGSSTAGPVRHHVHQQCDLYLPDT